MKLELEEGMRNRRLCTNEEYLRIDDDYIKNELTNEIPELMEQLRVLLSRLHGCENKFRFPQRKFLKTYIYIE